MPEWPRKESDKEVTRFELEIKFAELINKLEAVNVQLEVIKHGVIVTISRLNLILIMILIGIPVIIIFELLKKYIIF